MTIVIIKVIYKFIADQLVLCKEFKKLQMELIY